MTTPTISILNLSKVYNLGAINRHTLVDEAQYLWHRLRGRNPNQHMAPIAQDHTLPHKNAPLLAKADRFWALKDVSFDVSPGEIVGIIGPNGSGKSTLLKILTRITEPTSGDAFINGRVASLLEVGTGFHPELTGRENVFMNGTILGMKKKEIAKKFDEIVAFSEIEKFIDTPVKRYSSGMYVRLAFAVAAHLNPDILLVDEVLAVGDASFQKRCIGKLEETAAGGRTILFVSHNLHAVVALCRSVVWLDHGRVRMIGPAREVVARYTQEAIGQSTASAFEGKWQSDIRWEGLQIRNATGDETEVFDINDDILIEIDLAQKTLVQPVRLVLRIRTADDEVVALCTSNWNDPSASLPIEACHRKLRCRLRGNTLNTGTYRVSVGVDRPRGAVLSELINIKSFQVIQTTDHGGGIFGQLDSILSPLQPWETVWQKPLTDNAKGSL